MVSVAVIGGRSRGDAIAFLHERYGPLVDVGWLGPSEKAEALHPFASWTSEGLQLRLFFSLDHNGEEVHSARVLRDDADSVEVALTRREPVGPQTLIGGYSTHHVDVSLAAPVGRRIVIDAATGAPRPAAERLIDS